MFVPIDKRQEEEPPAGRAAVVAGKVSQALLFLLGASPIAIFAIALAHRLILFLCS